VDTLVLTGQLTDMLAQLSVSVDDRTLARIIGRLGEPSRFDDTCVLAVRVIG
jgi:hypothetical protein